MTNCLHTLGLSSVFKTTLGELYLNEIREHEVRTVSEYVACARKSGDLSSLALAEIIRPSIFSKFEDFATCMRQIGRAADLVVAVLDLKSDINSGKINIIPSFGTKSYLFGSATVECLKLVRNYPSIIPVALRSPRRNFFS